MYMSVHRYIIYAQTYICIYIASFPGSPPCARNYCVTFELSLARKNECEFKGHAIIAGAWAGTRLTQTHNVTLAAHAHRGLICKIFTDN